MTNVHDKLFKQMMSLKSQAVALASSFLPQDVLDEIDLDSFELSNVSFIDAKLKEYFADIIYTCNTKENKEIKISFLLEHKSYYDPHLPLQLLRYLVEGYDYQYVKEDKKELSLIIPVLIYHGATAWQKREIEDMLPLSNAILGRYIPNFNYDVIDLLSTTDAYLKSMEIGHLLPATFLLFKHRGDKDYFLENIENILIFVKRTVTEEERNLFIKSLKRYIIGIFEMTNQEIMIVDDWVKEMVEEKSYLPGSAADRLLTEGREEGREEGRDEGEFIKSLVVSLNLLKALPHFSDVQIADLAETDKEVVAALKKIVKKNTPAKVKKLIFAKFFTKIKLSTTDKKKLGKDIDNYFKVDKK